MVIRETSAGFIVFYFDKERMQVEYLLLLNSKGHWDFPKGHVEEGESLIEGAKRELEEEAGIKSIKAYPTFMEKISYYYVEQGERRFKEVYFFLGEVASKEVKISFEHTDYRWVSCEEGIKLLSYENSKKVLKRACEFIEHYIIKSSK